MSNNNPMPQQSPYQQPSQFQPQQYPPKKKHTGWIVVGVILGIVIIIKLASGGNAATPGTPSPISKSTVLAENSVVSTPAPTEASVASTQAPTAAPKAKLTIGDTVVAGNFEFTVTKAEVKKIDNQFADQKEAVAVYVDIKNIGEETNDIMMLQHSFFGPSGKEAESIAVSVYFNDAISVLEKIRAGNTLSGYLVCEYLGDGEYITEVSELLKGDPTEIYFNVKK